MAGKDKEPSSLDPVGNIREMFPEIDELFSGFTRTTTVTETVRQRVRVSGEELETVGDKPNLSPSDIRDLANERRLLVLLPDKLKVQLRRVTRPEVDFLIEIGEFGVLKKFYVIPGETPPPL